MLALRQGDLDAILGHAKAELPREACGVLGGRRRAADLEVEVVHPCRNAAAHPEAEFVAHPQDQLHAFLDIEDARGLEVVGVYHSHPRGPPRPSAVDAARAAYPGLSYLLVWLAPQPAWGAWRWLPPKGFEPEPVALRR